MPGASFQARLINREEVVAAAPSSNGQRRTYRKGLDASERYRTAKVRYNPMIQRIGAASSSRGKCNPLFHIEDLPDNAHISRKPDWISSGKLLKR